MIWDCRTPDTIILRILHPAKIDLTLEETQFDSVDSLQKSYGELRESK
jgi:hypothetical protein